MGPGDIAQPFVEVGVWFVKSVVTVLQYAVAGWIGRI